MNGFLKDAKVIDIFCLRFFYCLFVLILILNRRIPDSVFNRTYYSELYFHFGTLTTASQVRMNQLLVLLSLTLAGLNLAPRFFLVLASFSYFNLVYVGNIKLNVHDDSLIPFVLLLLALAPKIRFSLSREFLLSKVNPLPIWQIKALLACVYLSAFESKLSNTGLTWANGTHLQNYLFERFAISNNPYAFWISLHPFLCRILSLGAVFSEGAFWLILFFPRLEKIAVPMGLGMHTFIWLCFDINFFPAFVITYLVFVPYSRIYQYLVRARC